MNAGFRSTLQSASAVTWETAEILTGVDYSKCNSCGELGHFAVLRRPKMKSVDQVEKQEVID